jgi:hypothetical protein
MQGEAVDLRFQDKGLSETVFPMAVEFSSLDLDLREEEHNQSWVAEVLLPQTAGFS